MEPTVVSFPGAVVVGIETRTRNVDESDTWSARIPRLWARFADEDVAGRLGARDAEGAGAPPARPIAVYTQYESDEHGAYTLLAGVPVEKGATVPEGMRMAILPEGRYLVFRADGEQPRALVDGWVRVWRWFERNEGERRSFLVDFELHEAADRAAIHIGIR